MTSNTHPGHRRAVVLILALALSLTACSGGDGDASPAEPSEQSAATGGEPADDALPVGDDSDLVVPLDYLQGEWCNTDGEAWVFEGDTARFGENHASGPWDAPSGDDATTGSSRRVLPDGPPRVGWTNRSVGARHLNHRIRLHIGRRTRKGPGPGSSGPSTHSRGDLSS